MAEVNGPSLTSIGLFSTMSLTFLVYHAYKFDRCKCLLPSKKEWYRTLLTWTLFLSNMCLLAWACGWSYVKYSLGWIRLANDRGNGARPWPSSLFPFRFTSYNAPLTVLLSIAYALQAMLTVQESLYWWHLFRAVRRPQAAKPFLRSHFFHAWIVISVIILAVQVTAPWINYTGNAITQLCIEFTTSGVIETVALLPSLLVIYRFPRFLREIEEVGAGPDVRSRMYYYNELNKARALCRVLFTAPLLIIGADGLQKTPVINLNVIASDFLATLLAGSFCLVTMISVVLYLPRAAPSADRHHVMVGEMPAHAPLMSLLRDGGGVDVDLAGGRRVTMADDGPFHQAKTTGKDWDVDAEDEWKGFPAQAPVPLMLETFTSPIAVAARAQSQRPVQIHIEVESEVHRD